jgi:hypothetical protein
MRHKQDIARFRIRPRFPNRRRMEPFPNIHDQTIKAVCDILRRPASRNRQPLHF